MSRVRAWVTVAAVAASLGSLTMSCGSDELTGDASGGGAGKGGTGGTSGTSGSGGRGGGGGVSGSANSGGTGPATSNLGKACVNDASCGTTSGLTCIVETAVPQGLCSTVCTTDANCQVVVAGARCTAGGFCLEGCSVGPLGLTDKCHNRADFGCRYASELMTSTRCTMDEQCGNSAICDTDAGTCVEVLTTCQPVCGSDDDCTPGFCNIGTGLCQETAPVGKGVGEDCNPDAATEECQGVCLGSAAGGYTCTGLCVFDSPTGCGWNGEGPASAGCLFVPIFNAQPDSGDALYCGELCDCDADCSSTTSKCVSFAPWQSGAFFMSLYQRKGLCAPPGAMDVTIPECTGAGGAGGAGG